jgi:hypothetical protein
VGSEVTARESKLKINWAIATLAISGLMSIVGAIFFHNADTRTGIVLAISGTFLMWPVSVVFAMRGRGAGRNVLLVGDALIALLLIFTLLCVWIYR